MRIRESLCDDAHVKEEETNWIQLSEHMYDTQIVSKSTRVSKASSSTRRYSYVIVASLLHQELQSERRTRITSLYSCSQWNYFHEQKRTNHRPPWALFPAQLLREHVAPPTCGSRAFRGGGSGFTAVCWRRVLGFIFSMRYTITVAWRAVDGRVCVSVCSHLYVCTSTSPENTIDPPNATLPTFILGEDLAECQFLNSCPFQWMHKSVTWLPQIGSESVEVLFLLATPGAQYFTATTVSHGEEQRCTFGSGGICSCF